MKSKYGFKTTKKRSDLMRKIKSKNTTPEILLRKELWRRGIRYRKNSKYITGNPDISMKKYKLAIFVDGEFWHGFNWEEKKKKIKNNKEYWIKKIEGNIARDIKVNKALKEQGWIVLRFWEHEIRSSIDNCIGKIRSILNK